MRAFVAASALALAACTASTPTEASAEDWASHLDIQATAVHGEAGQVRLVLQGKEGWYVNTAYPGIKVLLTPPAGVTLEKGEVGKKEVTYEETKAGDKARRAVFVIPLQAQEAPSAPIRGEYKLVMCTDTTCSPPFKGTFEIPFQTGGE